MASTTASRKAKGRRLQQWVRDLLRLVGKQHGLVDDDIESRGMGQAGVDIILTPAAKKAMGDMAIECKNTESLNVTTVFWEHADKYTDSDLSLLFHKRNGTDPLVTLKAVSFIGILERELRAQE